MTLLDLLLSGVLGAALGGIYFPLSHVFRKNHRIFREIADFFLVLLFGVIYLCFCFARFDGVFRTLPLVTAIAAFCGAKTLLEKLKKAPAKRKRKNITKRL